MMRTIKTDGIERLILLLFGTGSILFLGIFYNDHIYRKEQLQLFELTSGYLLNSFSHQGGLSIWISEFLIQFFHLPFTGAILITILVLLLQRLTKNILAAATGKSPVILLSMLPALGYWIILLNDYYPLSGLVGMLLSLICSLFYLNLYGVWKRVATGFILMPLVYWLTGGAFLVFAGIIIISEILIRYENDGSRIPVPLPVLTVLLIFTFIIPLAAREFLFKDTILQSFVSEAYYSIRIFFPLPVILIFISVPAFIALLSLFPRYIQEKQSVVYLSISVSILLCFAAIGVYTTADFKAEKTMAYENLIYKGKWDKIITRAEKEKPSDNVSLAAVNVALAKTGQLSTKMFLFGQTENSLFLKYVRKGMTPFIASEPFYQLGLFNFAQMFAMETIESTPDSKYPVRSFRRVAETYIINGQYDIAMKYLVPLSHTLFYRKWANEAVLLLHDKNKIDSDPYWGSMTALRSKYDFYYNPQQFEQALRYLLVSNPQNKTAYEYIMASYLLKKDFDGFLAYLPLSDTLGYRKLPEVWQEAAAYIGTRVDRMPVQLEHYTIDPDVISRLRDYAQSFSTSRQDTLRMKKRFGNTLWYYLHYK